MLNAEEGNKIIGEYIRKSTPLSIIRLRSETNSLYWFINDNYPDNFPQYLENNGGLYPLTKDIVHNYNTHVIEGLKTCDFSVYWRIHDKQYKDFTPIQPLQLIHNRCVEPFYFDDPWSQYLKNKKVLIVHPFVDTIKSQYVIKDKLFKNNKILPNFNLLYTIKSVQTSGGGERPHLTWIDSLNSMITEIKQIDFDVALLGCGCYDIPLSTAIKKMGKQSIIVGGGLQILFGIKGKRWDNHPIISTLYNEYWVRPSENEKPSQFNNIEKGCYW